MCAFLHKNVKQQRKMRGCVVWAKSWRGSQPRSIITAASVVVHVDVSVPKDTSLISKSKRPNISVGRSRNSHLRSIHLRLLNANLYSNTMHSFIYIFMKILSEELLQFTHGSRNSISWQLLLFFFFFSSSHGEQYLHAHYNARNYFFSYSEIN